MSCGVARSAAIVRKDPRVDKLKLFKLDWICAKIDIYVKGKYRVRMEGLRVVVCVCTCMKEIDMSRIEG